MSPVLNLSISIFISIKEGGPSTGADLQGALHLQTLKYSTKYKCMKELEKVMNIGRNTINS